MIHFEFIALLAHFCSKFKSFLSHIVTGKAPPQKRFALQLNQILLASAELLSQTHLFGNHLSLQTTNVLPALCPGHSGPFDHFATSPSVVCACTSSSTGAAGPRPSMTG